MMDNLFNTKEKRFVSISALYGFIIISFLYRVYRFSAVILSINSSAQLMILTNPETRSLYWPIAAIAKIMDQRFNFLNVTFSIIQAIPISFYIGLFAVIYLTTLAFDKKHTFYKYQQGILILTLSLILSQFAMILLFLYGFLGGSVASAISRLHISGYVGKISAIAIVVVFLIVFFKLILDLLEISK